MLVSVLPCILLYLFTSTLFTRKFLGTVSKIMHNNLVENIIEVRSKILHPFSLYPFKFFE